MSKYSCDKTIGQFGFFPMTLQGAFISKEMSQETSNIARAVTAIPLDPSNQHLASVKAILIKFTQLEMESLGAKIKSFQKVKQMSYICWCRGVWKCKIHRKPVDKSWTRLICGGDFVHCQVQNAAWLLASGNEIMKAQIVISYPVIQMWSADPCPLPET